MAAFDTGNDTLGLLEALLQLQSQPLVPSDNPALQLGSVLSGFAAGTQGQANPVLTQLASRRQQDLGTGLAAAGMRLNVDTARQTARHQESTETEARLSRETRERELALSTGRMLLDQASNLREPKLAKAGYTRLADAGMLPEAFKDPSYIEQASQKAINQADFMKQETLLAAKALTYADSPSAAPDPDLLRLAPNFIEMAKTPEGRTALKMAYKLPSPKLYLLDEKTKELESEVKTAALMSEQELAKSLGVLYPLAGKNVEQLVTHGMLLRSAGHKLPAALEKVLTDYNAKFALGLSSERALVELHRKQSELATEALDLKRKTASIEEIGAFIDKLQTLSRAAFEINFAPTDVKDKVLKPFKDLSDEMGKVLAKRLEQASQTPPPAAKVAPVETADDVRKRLGLPPAKR